MRPPAAILLALLLLVSACADDAAAPGPSASDRPGVTATPATPTPSTPASEVAPDPASEEPVGDAARADVTLRVVGEGFEQPVQVLAAPDGTTLVVEQAGRVTTLAGEVVVDLTDRVDFGGERGLLAATFVDDVAGTRRLFLHYSGDGGATVVSSLPWPDPRPEDEVVLLTVPQPAANHNGGSLVVGPDGMLYLALGDGGAGNDRFGNGQRPDTVLGAILRLDPHGAVDALPPAADNPNRDGWDPAVWAYGLRNPWRIAFGRGHLVVADVGQDAVEEVSVVPLASASGANFGWPVLEGSRCFRRDGCDTTGLVLPVLEFSHADDGVCSIIGGVVYEGRAIPELAGHYLVSDLCAGFLQALPIGGTTAVDLTPRTGGLAQPLGFGVDAAGEVHVCLRDGRVLQLVPA